MPKATEAQKIATGFHRNTQINQEGGIDKEQFRIDSVFDRVATTGTVWLGLSVGCAQCHDHKYDPISQEEFFKFYAFFNNTVDDGHGKSNPGGTLEFRDELPKTPVGKLSKKELKEEERAKAKAKAA